MFLKPFRVTPWAPLWLLGNGGHACIQYMLAAGVFCFLHR